MTKKKTKQSLKIDSLPATLDGYLRGLAQHEDGDSAFEWVAPAAPFKELFGRFVELAFQAEMDEHLGYRRHKRIDPLEAQGKRRKNTRNGAYEKTIRTSIGRIRVSIPRDRDASFEPLIVPKFEGVTEELVARIMMAHAQNRTPRDIETNVGELYAAHANAALVSRVVERVEPVLDAWRNRAQEAVYPLVFAGVMSQEVHSVWSADITEIYQISGYNEAGQPEILGLYQAPKGLGKTRSTRFWHQVFEELEGRGVNDIRVFVADGLSGLEQAVEEVFPRAYVLCARELSARYASDARP